MSWLWIQPYFTLASSCGVMEPSSPGHFPIQWDLGYHCVCYILGCGNTGRQTCGTGKFSEEDAREAQQVFLGRRWTPDDSAPASSRWEEQLHGWHAVAPGASCTHNLCDNDLETSVTMARSQLDRDSKFCAENSILGHLHWLCGFHLNLGRDSRW